MKRTFTIATLCLTGLMLVGAADASAQDEGEEGKSSPKSLLSLQLRQLAKPKADGAHSPWADSLLKRLKIWRPTTASVDPDMVIRPDPSLYFGMPVIHPDPNVDREMIYPRDRVLNTRKKKWKR